VISIALVLCKALVWLVPPTLFTGRFFWPRYFPWWTIVLVSGLFSYFLLTEIEHLQDAASYEATVRCLEAQKTSPEMDCPYGTSVLYAPQSTAKALPGVVILLLGLPLYWGALWLRKRSRPPNCSLERSRDA
jgi:hypothetical protein